MAERSEKVQERVREELARNPEAKTQALKDAAQSVDPSVEELSLRQFNAGYVLPLKRGKAGGGKRRSGGGKGRRPAAKGQAAAPSAPERPARGGKARAEVSDRELVRATLLEFARDFSEAESRSAIVAVLSDLDRYVDRIVGSRG